MNTLNFWKIILLLIAISVSGCSGGGNKVDEDVKVMAQKIKQGLDQYAREANGIYPTDLNAMFDAGYLVDAFDDHFKIPDLTNINFGEKPFEGKFTYIPFKINGERRAYYLLGYGSSRNTKQMDVDKDGKQDFVQIVLKGPDDPDILSQLPPLETLLKK